MKQLDDYFVKLTVEITDEEASKRFDETIRMCKLYLLNFKSEDNKKIAIVSYEDILSLQDVIYEITTLVHNGFSVIINKFEVKNA